jgi:hypothetical protein
MDVDAACHWKSIPTLCRCCGEPGHIARDCTRTYVVHYMTLEEKETWIEQHLSAVDVTAVEVQSETLETLDITNKSLESPKESFTSHSE